MTSLPEKMKGTNTDTEMVENVKFHIMKNKTHILASVLFPLETTSAARTNPSVACRHLFKLRPYFLFFQQHLSPGRVQVKQAKLTNPEPNPEDASPVKWQTFSQESPSTTYTPHIVWGIFERRERTHSVERQEGPVSAVTDRKTFLYCSKKCDFLWVQHIYSAITLGRPTWHIIAWNKWKNEYV